MLEPRREGGRVSNFCLEPAQPGALFGPLRSTMDAYEKLEKIGEGVSLACLCLPALSRLYTAGTAVRVCVECSQNVVIQRVVCHVPLHRFYFALCHHLYDGPRSFSA